MSKWSSIGLVFLLNATQLGFSDQVFKGKEGEEIRIQVVKKACHMNLDQSSHILVQSFMHAYEDVALVDLNPEFKSIGDVRRFYERYFQEEFEHFQKGDLIWAQAFVNNELAGWATFELEGEQQNTAYMNLLAVSPKHQHKGVGTYLTFSICCDELFPSVHTINLLIRKVNHAGYLFYRSIGFIESDYARGNFVDPALLTGLTWRNYGNN